MEKNTIKQYFRSGSRPTQEHFYALIDACYNENYSVYVSGYEIKTEEIGEHSLVKTISMEAGKTHLVPWFKRINIPHTRTYHYCIHSCNLGPKLRIHKINMELQLPKSSTYEVKDKTSTVKISQTITLDSIVFYNGTEAFLNLSGADIPEGPYKEFTVDAMMDQWKAISVDISVGYDIKSNIAVSDQFDMTERNTDELLHVFGGVGFEFKAAIS